MRIQIISDMHLEFRDENFKRIIKPSAPILFLLGDICVCGDNEDFKTFKKFMSWISTKFKYVFYVSGNHEYYSTTRPRMTIDDIDRRIKVFTSAIGNVFYLNNSAKKLDIGGKTYVFVGTTLWSGVRPEDRKELSSQMNDYENIYVKSKDATRRYNIEDMTKLHINAVNYIRAVMKTIKPSETAILLTHHKPVRDDPITNVLSQGYETDLEGVVVGHPFKLAAHGHTHVKYDKVINGVHVVSNPKGYPYQKTAYEDVFVVSV